MDLRKRLSRGEMLSRLRDIPSDTYNNENKIVFEEESDGSFASLSSLTDSESDDCAQEIDGTGKLLIA